MNKWQPNFFGDSRKIFDFCKTVSSTHLRDDGFLATSKTSLVLDKFSTRSFHQKFYAAISYAHRTLIQSQMCQKKIL